MDTKLTVQDQLAFVGLGAMGKRMAANLAKHLETSHQVLHFSSHTRGDNNI